MNQNQKITELAQNFRCPEQVGKWLFPQLLGFWSGV